MIYGDYLVFVDESGDYGLVSIDPDYPVFVLDFRIVPSPTGRYEGRGLKIFP